MINTTPRRVSSLAPLLMLTAIVAGCGTMAPGGLPPGTPIAEARHAAIAPTGDYPLPNGGTRLEFAQGSFGKQTYMLDFDANGLLVSSQQVLTEANFATITPGMQVADLRMRLGRPAQVIPIGWQKLHVWNYRYFAGDCVWFQVSVSDAEQRVTDAGMGQDPACDGPKGARD